MDGHMVPTSMVGMVCVDGTHKTQLFHIEGRLEVPLRTGQCSPSNSINTDEKENLFHG